MAPKAMKTMKAEEAPAARVAAANARAEAKARAKAKAAPKAKANAKAKAMTGTAVIDENLLPRLQPGDPNLEDGTFKLWVQEADGQWVLTVVGMRLTVRNFIIYHMQDQYQMDLNTAIAESFTNFYMTTIGGKILPKDTLLCQLVDDMSHVAVVERRRGGMQD